MINEFAGRRRQLILALLLLTLALPWCGGAFAGVIEVPGDFETIQEAVDSAAEGDSILVSPGTYSRTWNRRITRVTGTVSVMTNVLVDVPVSIIGRAGAEATVLLGSGLGPVVIVLNARGVLIEGFTITGGTADETLLDGGGGIYCELSDLEVRSCIIEDNGGPFGAGIGCFTASGPWIHENIIRNNGECEFGGGIALMGGSSGTIEYNVLSKNTANIFGGAMFIGEQSTATVENNTLVGNAATSGSSIFCRNGSEIDASRNIFAQNMGGTVVMCDKFAQGRPCVMNLICNDFWDNSGESIEDCISGANNRETDPFLCSPETGDFSLCYFSPSLMTGDGCGRRGALGAGCNNCPVEKRLLTWGYFKTLYR